MRGFWLVLGAGALGLEGTYLAIAQLGNLRLHAAPLLWLAAGALVMYLGIVWYVRRTLHVQQPLRPSTLSWAIFLIVSAAVLFRATLFPLSPTLSDDAYRYVWDGRVQAAGINPYRYAPSDPALAQLRTSEWESINHQDIPTIYPPVSQLAFRLGVMLGPTVLMQKIVFLICDLLLIAVLVIGLPRLGISALMSLVYAWHPLTVIEIAGSGHNDALGILWMMLALVLWMLRRPGWSVLMAVLSGLSKFATLLWVPFYAVRARRWLWMFLGLSGLAMGWTYCSPHFAWLGHTPHQWEFNSSLYGVLVWMIRDPAWARWIVVGSLGLLGIFFAIREEDLVRYTLVMLQAAILLMPVVEPWYLLWVLPLLCVRFSWMWTMFAGLVLLSYVVLIAYVQRGIWIVPLWVKCVEYAPLYGWLGWCAMKRLAAMSRATSAHASA